MTLDRFCSRIIHLAHTPIRVYNLAEPKGILDCGDAFFPDAAVQMFTGRYGDIAQKIGSILTEIQKIL